MFQELVCWLSQCISVCIKVTLAPGHMNVGARMVFDPEHPPPLPAPSPCGFLRSLGATRGNSGNFGQALVHVTIGTFEKLKQARNRCWRKVLRAGPLRHTHCQRGGGGSTGGESRLSELQQRVAEAPGGGGEGDSRKGCGPPGPGEAVWRCQAAPPLLATGLVETLATGGGLHVGWMSQRPVGSLHLEVLDDKRGPAVDDLGGYL